MTLRRLLVPILVLGALVAAAQPAAAGNYVVYLHGRSMGSWPSAALLGAPAGWSHVRPGYDGSARLADPSARAAVTNTIAAYCGSGNQCVIVCYSAGCARMLDAFTVLKDQGRYPGGILWSHAAGSAAGGSELAVYATKWWVKLLAKIFNTDEAAPIDYDIQPNVMRYGAFASVQNQATAPVYHVAGSQNICQTLRILFFKVKLCGNRVFPGDYGDGAVPVHSAAGYADTGAHASTNDGSAKYLFRAYEQTPLYPVDHRGILGPSVVTGSLRLAVTNSPSCPNMPAGNTGLPDASIIYDDGDGAFAEESSPLSLLILCGESVWNGGPALYATCYSTQGCCTSFSSGSAGGCTCGETLCRQSKIAYRSYYASHDCTGTEYAESLGLNSFVSWDGLGMVGESTTPVVVSSARTADGACSMLVHQTTWSGYCPELYPTSRWIGAARVVYRPAGSPPPPTGYGEPLVVSWHDNPNTYCP